MKKISDDKSNFTFTKGESAIPRFSGIGRYVLAFGLGILVGVPALTLYQSERQNTTNHLLASSPVQDITKQNTKEKSLALDSLLRMSDGKLARLDLVRMNLLCAEI